MGRRVSAVVSSDDTYLSHGGGVSKSIWAAAGSIHLPKSVPDLRVGDIYRTVAGELDADWVVHAITARGRVVRAASEVGAMVGQAVKARKRPPTMTVDTDICLRSTADPRGSKSEGAMAVADGLIRSDLQPYL